MATSVEHLEHELEILVNEFMQHENESQKLLIARDKMLHQRASGRAIESDLQAIESQWQAAADRVERLESQLTQRKLELISHARFGVIKYRILVFSGRVVESTLITYPDRHARVLDVVWRHDESNVLYQNETLAEVNRCFRDNNIITGLDALAKIIDIIKPYVPPDLTGKERVSSCCYGLVVG